MPLINKELKYFKEPTATSATQTRPRQTPDHGLRTGSTRGGRTGAHGATEGPDAARGGRAGAPILRPRTPDEARDLRRRRRGQPRGNSGAPAPDRTPTLEVKDGARARAAPGGAARWPREGKGWKEPLGGGAGRARRVLAGRSSATGRVAAVTRSELPPGPAGLRATPRSRRLRDARPPGGWGRAGPVPCPHLRLMLACPGAGVPGAAPGPAPGPQPRSVRRGHSTGSCRSRVAAGGWAGTWEGGAAALETDHRTPASGATDLSAPPEPARSARPQRRRPTCGLRVCQSLMVAGESLKTTL
ncbi:translation initiation factor IF-2-like [Equus quagga]|uniref:translation initiation factor IF-2-like n=1 Tax=Equus quagga TaxID=89248 RepID=UPI001EE188C4|nr:translation initiation factor IF-2-like [Equus quagga]